MASQYGKADQRSSSIGGDRFDQSSPDFQGVARSTTVPQRLRNEEASWVEISSQPSSSSLSSIGDEIVTTGLRVQQSPVLRRRRRLTSSSSRRTPLPKTISTSSQEEYDESESEEDQILSSSNEQIAPFSRVPPVVTQQADLGSESDDDDGNATALGRVYDEPAAFTPQPNVFSHPPTARNHASSVPGSYFPNTPARLDHRQSYPGRTSSRPQHSPYNAMHPNHRVDHEEALRASLTTLLSCAAAARGLPKRAHGGQQMSPPGRSEFNGFRLFSEAEVTGTSPIKSSPNRPSPKVATPTDEASENDKGKRKAGGGNAATKASSQPRAIKKKRVEEAMISPTLVTWIVSAGVVVLVSVVGFGAGYVIGREVGRQEAIDGIGGGVGCGKELARGSSGLRKFRWGAGRGITV